MVVSAIPFTHIHYRVLIPLESITYKWVANRGVNAMKQNTESEWTQDQLETLRDKWEDKLMEATEMDDPMSIEQARNKLNQINALLN